jgi:hypothetical protein
MKVFPNSIAVKKIDDFEKIYELYVASLLRKEIFPHVLRNQINNTEENYFSLDGFDLSFKINNMDIVKKVALKIIDELKELGWFCELYYGDTGLFIYKDENKRPFNLF